MIRKGIFIFLCGILAFGCKAKKEVATTKATQTVQSNTNQGVTGEQCVDTSNDLFWTEVTDQLVKKNFVQFSEDFKLFQVDETRLRSVFDKNIKKDVEFELSVPVYINNNVECSSFKVRNSETIAREVQMRMGVFSFKGEGLNNPMNTARFDFTPSTGLRSYIQLEGETFLLEPVMLNKTRFYISFSKKNASAIKKQFPIE